MCEPEWSVIDVGANLGYHTVHLANLVGKKGSVLAVEANPDNCLLINAAVEANHFSNVQVLPCALGSERGWSYFTTHVGTNGGLLGDKSAKPVVGAGTVVPLFRMDDLLNVNMPLNLIKVDVEGAEGLVMQGGSENLARHRPVVISEFSFDMLRRVSGWDPRQYLEVFRQLDYRLNVIDKESPGNLVPQDYDELLESWPDEFHIEDLLLTPR
ncbi:MAG: FkbM family methyltransferase [Acidimicrobiales bacterium]